MILRRTSIAFSVLIAIQAPMLSPTSLAQTEKKAVCDENTIKSLLQPNANSPFLLSCSLVLPKGVTLRRSIIFEGSQASHTTLDCNGSIIDVSDRRTRIEKTAIIVRSKHVASDEWDAPQHVVVQNCTVKGFMRVYGLDENANGDNMRASSRRPDHTEFAQSSAPKRTTFRNLTIVAPEGAPLYIGPGATWTTLENSRLTGSTTGTAIYMDAESGRNSIKNNQFSISTRSRELIAIDGSTRNEVVGNVFENPVNGGVFLYRNCGEGGVIRHQRPDFNVISKNIFKYVNDGVTAKPAVWLGSRAGKQKFCFKDPAYPFGSSLSFQDFAQKNTVEDNRFIGGRGKLIRDDDRNNLVGKNSGN